ncbi:hypothetical protein Tco_1515235 [Tanacetum coccineum]
MNRHSFVHPHPSSHPLADHLLKLALSLPVATAMVERCFSKMKLLRKDLRMSGLSEDLLRVGRVLSVSLVSSCNSLSRKFARGGLGGVFNWWGVYVCVYVDYVGVGTQSIERDRLIGIGVVLDNSFRSLLSDEDIIIEI